MSNPIFKPAKSNNRIWNLVKTILQTSVFWLVFLYLIPLGILEIEESLAIQNFGQSPKIGWLFFILLSMLGIYSGITMSWRGKGTPLPLDCPNQLVIAGPYRFVRNPMAVAGIGQGICVGIICGSYSIILYALSGAVLWHLFVRPIEEQDLEKRFGEPYISYKKRIKCWLPSSPY